MEIKAPYTVKYNSEAAAPEHEFSLWYRKPAVDWEKEALPIGNGYIGGMVFGGVSLEHIQYNEKTLWTGGPGEMADYQGGNVDGAAAHLQSIRNKLWAGDLEGAAGEARGVVGNSRAFGAYQTFGDIYLNFEPASDITVSDYRRELDLEEGIARVSYILDGVHYTREYFCSYPDKVMVMRLTSSRPGMLCLDIAAECSHESSTITTYIDTLITRGNIKSNNMVFESQIKVINEGGTLTAGKVAITVNDADALTVIMAAGTDYENSYPLYKGADPHEVVLANLKAAASKSYSELKARHLSDYKALFDRVFIDLGGVMPGMPTDELRSSYADNPQKGLETLMFQYGRYLLISSSRQGSLPANLQGVWNNAFWPPWCCDYHFNINIQMNYWPAEVANLSECAVPLIDYTESLRVPGRITAGKHFGVTGGGWVVNTMNNPFGYTAPGWDFNWGWAPNSNAFVCRNLWDYYAYTNDIDCLRNKIYPIMKEAAQFWADWLVPDTDGTLVSTPSYSPEHGSICIGAAMDQQLAWDLFTNVINASEILGVDEEFREELADKRQRLSAPVRVGRWGQIQEWKEDLDDKSDNHRHISQLVALYPGKLINRDTPDWLEAAKVTMLHRGDESTGWSRSNKLNLWARALDGNHAYILLQGQLNTCTYPNLFDTHPPYQIDGNLGYVSGVCEMLLQSHMDQIELLPALPDAWAKGRVTGMLARGAFEVGMDWEGGSIKEASIRSIKGNTCRIRSNVFVNQAEYQILQVPGNTPVFYEADDDTVTFDTAAGESYRIIIRS